MLLGLILVVAGGAAYIAWTLVPPGDVVGSTLSGFWGEDRRRRMIRLEEDQDFEMFRENGCD